jgi:hypothetical protein
VTPQTLAERYVRKSLRESSRVAALILRHCPEFISNERPDETVDRYLRRIGLGTIRHAAVVGITERARVNGSRRIADLLVWQRHALADELERFSREIGE